MLLQCFFVLINLFCIYTDDKWIISLTSLDLKERFKSRCLEFGKFPRTSELYMPDSFTEAGCGVMWNAFKASASRKDPCSVTYKSYDSFLKKADERLKDKDSNGKFIDLFRDKVFYLCFAFIIS